eukprot:TRINITY_DN20617_c0_g1_i1.p1 TRINITY_DN20617_c0_g1~~TRINITY_DN20617_c0_g1_i1.p1  ORF type:complete len:476 (+),score=83.00 TRINITY_DN20617_c0_g1_i1:53-1429(+)
MGLRRPAAALQPLWDIRKPRKPDPNTALLHGSVSDVVQELRAQFTAPSAPSGEGVKTRKLHARRLVKQYMTASAPQRQTRLAPKDARSLLADAKKLLSELVATRSEYGAVAVLQRLCDSGVKPDGECFALVLEVHAVNGDWDSTLAVTQEMGRRKVALNAECRRAFIRCASVQGDEARVFELYDNYTTAGHRPCPKVILYVLRVVQSCEVAQRLARLLPREALTSAHLAALLRVYAQSATAEEATSLWAAWVAAQAGEDGAEWTGEGNTPHARLGHFIAPLGAVLRRRPHEEVVLVHAMMRVYQRDMAFHPLMKFMKEYGAWEYAGSTAYGIAIDTCADCIIARIDATPSAFLDAAEALWMQAGLKQLRTTYSIYTAMMSVYAEARQMERGRVLFEEYHAYRLQPKEEFYARYAALLRRGGELEEAQDVMERFQALDAERRRRRSDVTTWVSLGRALV